MAKLNFQKDVQGFNSFSPVQADQKYSATLASSGNSTITVPSTDENWVAAFSFAPGATMWVSVGGTAAAPAGATFASTTSELNPGSRKVKAGDVIDILNSGTASEVGVVLYVVE